jgi:hypothetical protein
MRGGGIGFFIKNNLNAQIIDVLSPFENKIIEALSIKISYPDNKQVIISSIYRSNGVIPNVLPSQQMERFVSKFSNLLTEIQNLKLESYIFIDSNIDLLKLNEHVSANYLNLILEKGFLQATAKATRIQNASKSLIDQILFNKNCDSLVSGTLISDVSDHFFTFIAPPGRRKIPVQKHTNVVSRDY